MSEGWFKTYGFVWNAEEPKILYTTSNEGDFVYPTADEKNAWYVNTNIS